MLITNILQKKKGHSGVIRNFGYRNDAILLMSLVSGKQLTKLNRQVNIITLMANLQEGLTFKLVELTVFRQGCSVAEPLQMSATHDY